MAKLYLYVLIEESFRELRSRLLITQAATSRGYEVILGQQWWFSANFSELPPGVVLFKGNNSIQANVMRAAREAGHHVASMEEEVFGLRSAEAILPIFDPRVADLCDVLLVQGSDHARILKEHFPGARGKIKITGNPRADILRRYRVAPTVGVANTFAQEHGEFVLINTNYGAINPYDFDALAFYSRCVNVGVINPNDRREIALFHTRCEWEKNNLREMVGFIRTLAERRPDIPIVLRPHPGENLEPWRIAMARHGSVHLVSDSDHVHWICAARCLVHTGSTTGLESFLLGTETIDICAGESEWHDMFIAPMVNTVVTTGEEAVTEIERVFSGGEPPMEIVNREAARLAALQGLLQTEIIPSSPTRIVDAIDEIAPDTRAVNDAGVLAIPTASARQRFKAFVSTDRVRQLLGEGDGVSAPVLVEELGAAVWRIRARETRVEGQA